MTRIGEYGSAATEPPDEPTTRICLHCEHFETPFGLGYADKPGVCRREGLADFDRYDLLLPWRWPDEGACGGWRDAT